MPQQPVTMSNGLPETKWIRVKDDRYKCPRCGQETNVDEVMGNPVYEYCPYCGKSMVKKVKQS